MWDLENPIIRSVGTDPVSALLPVVGGLYTAAGRRVLLLETSGFTVLRQLSVSVDEMLLKVDKSNQHIPIV